MCWASAVGSQHDAVREFAAERRRRRISAADAAGPNGHVSESCGEKISYDVDAFRFDRQSRIQTWAKSFALEMWSWESVLDKQHRLLWTKDRRTDAARRSTQAAKMSRHPLCRGWTGTMFRSVFCVDWNPQQDVWEPRPTVNKVLKMSMHVLHPLLPPPSVIHSDMVYDPEYTTGLYQREPQTLWTVASSSECYIWTHTD